MSGLDRRELILQVQVDLAFTIGSELSVPALLRKTLQRFMYHTGFPVGMMLAFDPDRVGHDEVDARLDVVIGDFGMLQEQGQTIRLPAGLAGDEAVLILEGPLLAGIATSKKMAAILVLPVPGYGSLLLLSPTPPENNLPLTTLFRPVLARLGNAILLCRSHEQEVQRKLLRSVIETIPDLIWVKDPGGIYLACNPRFERLYGASAEDIVGKTDADFVGQELAEFFRTHDLAAINAGMPLTNEEWLTFKADGYRGLFETVKAPMYEQGGELIGVLGISRDITERKRAAEQLKLAASVFSETGEGIIITDAQGSIIEVNRAFSAMSGYDHDELIGQKPSILKSGRHDDELYRDMWEALRRNGGWRGEIWNRRKTGELFATRLAITAVTDSAGQVAQYVAMFSDVTDQKQQQEYIQRLAYYDALTHLPNRVLLADRLQQSLMAARRKGTQVVVCFIDLDNFKPVNDRFGHPAGDAILVEVAQRLSDSIRPQDTAARIGGDEFILILTEIRDAADYAAVLERVVESLKSAINVGEPAVDVNFSASIGVSIFPADDSDPDRLLRHADQAMYLAKQAGGDRIAYYDPLQDLALKERQEKLDRVREALANQEFRLYWQPIVDLGKCKVVGAEALIRWLPPDGRLVMPADFLPYIEDDEIMTELGHWVLDAAVSQVAEWHAAGLDLSGSVNLAARQLHDPDFVRNLSRALERHPSLPPGNIELEILETAALEDLGRVNQIINQCRAIGIRFALDDFGTGYSSMTYLRRLAVDTVKIDQSFVRGMLDDENDLAIVQGIVGMASAFGRRMVAEGVESSRHAERLHKLGCQLAQGYAFARPMPAEAFGQWLAKFPDTPGWIKDAGVCQNA